MAAVIENSGITHNTSGTTPSHTIAVTPTSGNYLITVLATRSNPSSITVPTGYTSLVTVDGGNHDNAMAIKVSDGTETSVQWTVGSNQIAQVAYLEVSGLASITPNVTALANSSGGSPVTSISTGTSATTTVADCYGIAIAGAQASENAQTGRAWTNGFAAVLDDDLTANRASLSVATKTLSTTQTVETTFSHTDAADQMTAGLVILEVAASSAEVDDINTDEVVEDGESGVTFTTTGFGSEISTATINDGTNSTSASNISSTSGAGTFDLPDVSGYSSDTAGSPFTSASHSMQATLGDGTSTANLGVTYNPKAGWAVVEVASAVKTQGSVFENFVGTITDTSQVLYPTVSSTSVSSTGVLTTDKTSGSLDMQFWDASDATWKSFSVIIGDSLGGDTVVQPVVSSMVLSMVSNTVK